MFFYGSKVFAGVSLRRAPAHNELVRSALGRF